MTLISAARFAGPTQLRRRPGSCAENKGKWARHKNDAALLVRATVASFYLDEMLHDAREALGKQLFSPSVRVLDFFLNNCTTTRKINKTIISTCRPLASANE